MITSEEQLMQMSVEEAFWAGVPTLEQVGRALDVWNEYQTMLAHSEKMFHTGLSMDLSVLTAPNACAPVFELYLDTTPVPSASDVREFLSKHMPEDTFGIRCRPGGLRLTIPRSVAYMKLVYWKLADAGFEQYTNVIAEAAETLLNTQTRLSDDDDDLKLHVRMSDYVHGHCSFTPDVGLRGTTMAIIHGVRCFTSNTPPGDYMGANRLKVYSLRELNRIDSGEYIPLPENIVGNIDPKIMIGEVPHLATKDGNRGKIAYTENSKKGAADVQSIMKPGKYLRRVLKEDISDSALKEVVAALHGAASLEVKVTADPETAKWVYMNGPSSCMSKGQSFFNETVDENDCWRHPIEALFDHDNDIALVYVMHNGRPCARALLNTDKMEYPTTYIGDWAKASKPVLDSWLEAEGYEENSEALDGQEIAKINVGADRYLCPYIDVGNLGVEFEFDHMVIGGEFKAHYNNGYVSERDGEDRGSCEGCDEVYRLEEMTLSEWDDHSYCEGCYDETFCRALSSSGTSVETMPTDLTIELPRRVTVQYEDVYLAHEEIDNDGLIQVSLVRPHNTDEIYDVFECLCDDEGEWVHCDDVFGTNDAPDLENGRHTTKTHAIDPTDDEVIRLGHMVWVVDKNEWRYELHVDADRIEVVNDVRFIPAQEDEDRQDVA